MPKGAPGVSGDSAREPLGEDAPLAFGRRAEEPPRLDPQPDRRAMPGQVRQGAAVAAVDSARQLTAAGAWNEPTLRTHVDRHSAGIRSQGDQLQLTGRGKQR